MLKVGEILKTRLIDISNLTAKIRGDRLLWRGIERQDWAESDQSAARPTRQSSLQIGGFQMKRFTLLFLLFGGVLFCAQYAVGATLLVGTCRTAPKHYSTISAAVAAAPSGSTVMVCPGTYSEQVIIRTPLDLMGITSGNSGRVIIRIPAGGVPFAFTSPIDGAVVAAQVLVTTGPVNIANITVDGTGNGISFGWIAGIVYESGASGTINGVTAREQTGSHGVGLWAENAVGRPDETVTIENSQVHDAGHTGILVRSDTNPLQLTAKVMGNQVINSPFGIRWNSAGSITGNVIADHTNVGIKTVSLSTASIKGNVISAVHGSGGVTGILVGGVGEIVTSNTIADENGTAPSYAIDLSQATHATIEGNKITEATNGIEFGCKAGNMVSGNTLNDVTYGLDSVPTGQSVPGTFQNVDTLRSGACK